jgi:polysaccharide biosynthesis protein PslG
MIPTADPAAHVFLWGHPETTDRDLRLVREAGFTWVKQRFEWRDIEKNGKGGFEWQEPDRIVQAISDSGLKLVARVDNQPKWASTRIAFPASGPPDRLEDWTDYLSALATRYAGRIHGYEIWNEPNLAREWGEQTPDPAAYTRLLQASYSAIKGADPRALVVTAGMAPTTMSGEQAMRDVDFYRGMYAAGARGSYDILGVHAPGFKADPCSDPTQVADDPDLTNYDPSPREARRVYAFRHVEDVRQLMVEQGDGARQVAILEAGWTSDRRPSSPYRWHAVSEEQQARNLAAAFRCARQYMSPWLAFMTVIYVADPSWTPQQEQFWWSITNPNGSPRPAYSTLKQALRP